MGHLVVLVRHLWLILSTRPEKKKVMMLDASLSIERLFGHSMQNMRQRFEATQKSTDVLKM